MPEIHEDNDELSYISKSFIFSNKFNLKKSKKQTKSDIIYENFNMKMTTWKWQHENENIKIIRCNFYVVVLLFFTIKYFLQ